MTDTIPPGQKLFAVAHIDFYSNNLTIEFIQADDWYQAVVWHSKIAAYAEDLEDWPQDLEELKQFFFDMDVMVDVREVPTK